MISTNADLYVMVVIRHMRKEAAIRTRQHRDVTNVGAADTDDGNPVYQLESGYRKSLSLESSAMLDVFSLVP